MWTHSTRTHTTQTCTLPTLILAYATPCRVCVTLRCIHVQSAATRLWLARNTTVTDDESSAAEHATLRRIIDAQERCAMVCAVRRTFVDVCTCCVVALLLGR